MNLNLFDDDFSPNYGTAPGLTLRAVLDKLGLNQSDLAERTARPKKTINEIIQGKAAITPDTALQFERVLGISASFWLNLERIYRAAQAKDQERARLIQNLDWLNSFPIKELTSRGWIRPCQDRVELMAEVLAFFGVAVPHAWDDVWTETRKATALRQQQTHGVDFGAVAVWLRKGEIEGRQLKCETFDEQRFRETLTRLRQLTTASPGESFREVQEQCAKAGVAVVLIRELPKIKVFGAARWLSPEKALIQLNLYYKRLDQLWFTFFHEAAHVLLHGRRNVFVDFDGASIDRQEAEANKFAEDRLIPPAALARFVAQGRFSRFAVTQFAREIDIDPGIVVGRLQHDKHIDWNQLTNLQRRVDWPMFT